MNRTLLWIIVVAGLVAGVAIYRSHFSKGRFNVAPDAERAIEKAMRR